MDAEYSRRGLTYVLKANSLIFLLCVWMFLLINFRVLLPLVVSWLWSMISHHFLTSCPKLNNRRNTFGQNIQFHPRMGNS